MQDLIRRSSTTLLLTLIMAVIVVTVAGVAVLLLYQVAIAEERARLTETAQSQARLIEAVARFDRATSGNDPAAAAEATLAQIRDAHDGYEGFAKTAEFTLGRMKGDRIEFLLRHRHATRYPPEDFPDVEGLAEPMRRALRGESGTMIGSDYRRATVLAAHEPVAVLDWGIVAKIDLAEVRAPFVRAGWLIAALTLALAAAGAALFTHITNPLIRKLRQSEARLALATIGTNTALWDWPDVTKDACWLSDQFYAILGYSPGEFPATTRQFWSMMHPDDLAPTRAALAAHLERGEPFDVEYRLRTKSGGYLWLHARGTAHRNERGGPVRMTGYSHDISKRKGAESALQDVNRALHMLSECNQHLVRARDGFELATGLCRHVVEIGGYAMAWVGYPKDDVEGSAWSIESAGHAAGYFDGKDDGGECPFSRGPAGRALRTGKPVVVDDLVHDPGDEPWSQRARQLGYRSCIALPIIYEQETFGLLEINATEPHAFRSAQTRRLLIELADDLAFGLSALRTRERERRAREAAEAGVRRLETIIEHDADGLIVVSEEARIQFTNSAAESLFGRPKQQLVGSPFGLPLGGDRAANLMILRPDRTEALAEMRAIAIDWDGSPAWIASLRDVTERERAQEQLRKLSHAVERSPAVIIITDREGRIEYVNHTFTAVTGYPREEVIGQNPRILQSGRTPPEVYRELWRAILSGETWQGEMLNRRKDGGLYWESSAISPILSADGEITHFIGIEQDVTELKKTREQLIQAQKMEAVGNLTGGIAHDFNNLLGVVLGNLQLVERQLRGSDARPAADERVLKRLATAIGAIMRGAELTQRLLAFSRRQVLEARHVDLNQVVEGMRHLFERTLGESIEVRVSAEPALWSVYLDPGQFENALLNLVVNARDAMPDGGVLSIETANVEIDERHAAEYAYLTPGDYVMVAVSDSGVGMSSEVKAQVFEPFFTTKEVGKGTGLGLSMVYGFVKQSNGHVNIYSELGLGTSIKLYFQRAAGTVEAAAGRQEEGGVPGGDETLLVVDDDAELRDAAAEFLGQLGYRVLVADSGPAAVEILQTEPRVALLFTDAVMPGGMSGADLARRARELRPGLAILFTSGYARDILSARILDEHEAVVIQKPYGLDALAHRVRTTLDSKEQPAARPEDMA
ncbi:PAS domain S-box protein [Thiococcus pfennigii]|uniref:PAS domain S-box protein n=1 Tax=Thiococcus pfennigii TaxID=1057 RepID=UPI001903374C|nr:PAS domain S-box protein [Thiococcus pfennigii]MBK1699797.1 hypothetical protein [Thiococcus pfennigii]